MAKTCLTRQAPITRHTERNAAIALAYQGGETLRAIGSRFGLCESRISYIALAQGVRLDPEQRRERCSRHSSRIAKDPVVRAKIAATIARRWAEGAPMGRAKLFADDPAKRSDYLTLRDAFGAAYAREALGAAA